MALAAADFNGDGKLDLAVANYDLSAVTILLGNGDGAFRTGSTVTVAGRPDSVAVGDFNGDGKLDLVTANTNTDNVSIALGNGDGTFGAPVSPAAGTRPRSVVVGDFNGDGKLDLAVANDTAGTAAAITWLLGQGDGRTFTNVTASTRSLSPYALAAGDFNGDGISDVAVAFRGPSEAQIFYGSLKRRVFGVFSLDCREQSEFDCRGRLQCRWKAGCSDCELKS